MEEIFSQVNMYGTLSIIVTFICGLAYTTIKYWIPMSKRYFLQKRKVDTQISNIIKYNSMIDSREFFIYNFNLSDITIHSKNVKMSYGRCLKTCSMKQNLKSLSMATDDIENMQIAIYKINPMINLTMLTLTIDNAKYFNNDYLLPIIQNSFNIESIVYQNGHLSSSSMNLLIKLPKLNFLIIDNIYITDAKAFSIMLFNLKVRQLAYHLKYGIYR